MDKYYLKRYIVMLCEHASNKKIAGQIIDRVTKTLDENEASDLIMDIIQMDFFLDIPGKTKEFIAQLTSLRDFILSLLEEYDCNDDGDILASDEDSEGNLK